MSSRSSGSSDQNQSVPDPAEQHVPGRGVRRHHQLRPDGGVGGRVVRVPGGEDRAQIRRGERAAADHRHGPVEEHVLAGPADRARRPRARRPGCPCRPRRRAGRCRPRRSATSSPSPPKTTAGPVSGGAGHRPKGNWKPMVTSSLPAPANTTLGPLLLTRTRSLPSPASTKLDHIGPGRAEECQRPATTVSLPAPAKTTLFPRRRPRSRCRPRSG